MSDLSNTGTCRRASATWGRFSGPDPRRDRGVSTGDRELLLGPKRFTDLKQALPTASPNALSDRLRELADTGVIRRLQLPPPGNVRVYELTAWGRGLEPIVVALGTWALAPADQLFVSPDSAMLTIRTYFVPT